MADDGPPIGDDGLLPTLEEAIADERAAQEKYDKAKISAASARDRALLKAGDDATKKARAQEEHRIAAEKAENIYRRECKAAEDRRELGRSHAAENATSKYD